MSKSRVGGQGFGSTRRPAGAEWALRLERGIAEKNFDIMQNVHVLLVY
jgi:hypothetical protein